MKAIPTGSPKLKEPAFLDGPNTLVAVLEFLPVQETRRVKQKNPTENTAKPYSKIRTTSNNLVDKANKYAVKVFTRMIPSLNEYVDAQRQGYSGREMTRKWVGRGRQAAEEFLKQNKLEPLMLDWCKLLFVCHWPDYTRRDITNLYVKGIIDGLTEAGYYPDDNRVIKQDIALAGVCEENPRVELFVYSVELTLEQEARILAAKRDELAKLRKQKRVA